MPQTLVFGSSAILIVKIRRFPSPSHEGFGFSGYYIYIITRKDIRQFPGFATIHFVAFFFNMKIEMESLSSASQALEISL